MHILLDDQTCETRANTVAEAIAEGVRLARATGRMVVDVFVDGELWSESLLASETALSRQAGVVRLNTVIAAELASQTLQQAADAVMEADRLQRDAAELIQSGQLPKAMAKLSEAIAIWSQVQAAAADGSEAVGLDLNAVHVDGVTMNRLIGSLNDRLKQVQNALQCGDTVTLSDTLLYDLPPVVTDWRSLLHELARLADQARLRGETK